MGDSRNRRDQGVNSSESMGQYGNYIVDGETKQFDENQQIAVIVVTAGTATVSGRQNIQDTWGEDIYPDWSSAVLPVGTWIVNLQAPEVIATDLTICYYGE